jgi:hypothetical protein
VTSPTRSCSRSGNAIRKHPERVREFSLPFGAAHVF